MEVTIRGRHADITPDFKERAISQVGQVDRFGINIAVLDVEVTHETNKRQTKEGFKVELTAKGAGTLLRASGKAAQMAAALDVAVKKLELQLRKVSERKQNHR
jgi:ribosomal subunit interface protein